MESQHHQPEAVETDPYTVIAALRAELDRKNLMIANLRRTVSDLQREDYVPDEPYGIYYTGDHVA